MPLPFLDRGELRDAQGNLIEAIVPITIHASSSDSPGPTGTIADFTAEAPSDLYDALRPSNRRLKVDGVTYTVMSARLAEILPITNLRLRRASV